MTAEPITGDDLTDMERRVRDSAAACIAALDDETVAECLTLIELDPDGNLRGVRIHPIEGTDCSEFRWAGIGVGIVSHAWLETGVMPDPWPPVWYDAPEDNA